MSRVRISATVDGERLEHLRQLTGTRDSQLLDAALAALLRQLITERERAALADQPYDDDPDLAWQAPSAPVLPYDGDVPPEVRALAATRRRR